MTAPRTVVVTGARGFIGRHASRRLAESGYEVIGIGHGLWDAPAWASWGLTKWYESEITVQALRRCTEAPYAIMHFAGGSSVPFSLANPLKDFERTAVTTANVLEFIRFYSPATRLVYPSSASVYGLAKTSPINEEEYPSPISPYGVHKWMAEQMVTLYTQQYEVSAAIMRFFSVYGCGLRKQLLWDACRKMSEGDYCFMGTGNEVRDWLCVEDAAELAKLAMENASSECPIVNGGTGEGVSVREILTHLAQHFQEGRVSLEFSGKQRPGDPVSFVADTSRARRWGWSPRRSWQDGLSEYAEWWQCELEMPVHNAKTAVV